MDLATLAGLVSGLIIIFVAIILDGDIGTFINVSGLMIVVGGTVSATLIKFPLADMVKSFKIGIRIAFKNSTDDPQALYDMAIEMAGMVRKNGLLALEGFKVDNDMFARGIMMATDGHDLDTIKDTLNRTTNMNIAEQTKGEMMFRGIGDTAPAFGMIGTLIGLVQMLANLDDPASIGPAMAIAMLTTFYGALMANLIALPMADKLFTKTQQDKLTREQIIDSVLLIQQQKSPAILQEVLSVYVGGKKPDDDDAGGA